MCRLLFVESNSEFKIEEHLKIFAELCKNSKEYQGHGWGCSYLQNDNWGHYKNILPIWEDNLAQFPSTKRLIVHARSAFLDKDIRVENNMPFYDQKNIFIFNGELRGVKIKTNGRIGAEKIFNFIKRFDKGNMETALKKGIDIIKKRSEYVKAMNIIIATKEKVYITSNFNEDEEYFSMSLKQDDNQIIICSDPYPNENGWQKIKNNFMGVF